MNMVSKTIVNKLQLLTQPHHSLYLIGQIKDVSEIKQIKQCRIHFSIGKYKDKTLCDVVGMNTCLMLLDRPWQFDVNTTHDG